MRRFKLVRISKRKVEVQKVRLKVNFGTLIIALLFACLVWLYVAGSSPKPLPPDPADTSVNTAEHLTEAGHMPRTVEDAEVAV